MSECNRGLLGLGGGMHSNDCYSSGTFNHSDGICSLSLEPFLGMVMMTISQ